MNAKIFRGVIVIESNILKGCLQDIIWMEFVFSNSNDEPGLLHRGSFWMVLE